MDASNCLVCTGQVTPGSFLRGDRIVILSSGNVLIFISVIKCLLSESKAYGCAKQI